MARDKTPPPIEEVQAAAPASAAETEHAADALDRTPIRVRATQLGYHGHLRRRPGDVFTVPAFQFATHWMERVDASTPERTSTANDEIRTHHDDTLAARISGGQRVDDDNPLGD